MQSDPPTSSRRQRGERAFTMVEVTVAGAIVALLMSGLFVLNSNVARMMRFSSETTNASAHLQCRVEQVRLANWNQLCDPAWIQSALLANPADTDANLSGLSETCTIAPYQSPTSDPPATALPPAFTVTRQTDGTTSMSPAGYSASNLLAQAEMLQVDLTVTWPSLGRTRSRAVTTLVSSWGISK